MPMIAIRLTAQFKPGENQEKAIKRDVFFPTAAWFRKYNIGFACVCARCTGHGQRRVTILHSINF